MLNPKIAVCIKQVPNTEGRAKFDWERGTLIRKGIENIINPDDLHAIELALQLKERYNGEITVFTMGLPQAEEALREALALEIDKGVLITDPRFAGSDTLTTSKILYRSIKRTGKFDIIITGFKTTDGSTAQVSYQLAEFFKIPHITQIHAIEIENNTAFIERLYGHEYQKIKTNLPILIAVNRTSNKARFMKFINIKKCFYEKITHLTMENIGGNENEYGLSGSPTITIKGDIVTHKRKQEEFKGNIDEKIDKLTMKLKKYGYI
ncbi:MAG: electron transfer flavoprotein subunit beta/FixA family protein [Promethearchaeota archaeon]